MNRLQLFGSALAGFLLYIVLSFLPFISIPVIKHGIVGFLIGAATGETFEGVFAAGIIAFAGLGLIFLAFMSGLSAAAIEFSVAVLFLEFIGFTVALPAAAYFGSGT